MSMFKRTTALLSQLDEGIEKDFDDAMKRMNEYERSVWQASPTADSDEIIEETETKPDGTVVHRVVRRRRVSK